MMLPVAGLGLWALNFHWHPAPPGSRQDQDEAIEEAALVRTLEDEQGQIKPRILYINIAGHDATPLLVERMARFQIVLRPISETAWSKANGDWEGHVIENKTGQPTSAYTIQPPTWNSSTSATVNISYVAAGLNGGGADYQVTWDGTKWVADKGETTWVS